MPGIAALDARRYDRYVGEHAVKRGAVVAVLGLASATQSRGYGAMGLGVAARAGHRHVVVHELDLVGAVVGAVGRQHYLQALERLQSQLEVEFVGAREHGWRGLSVVGHKPSARFDFFHKILAGKSECEVKTRRKRAEAAGLAKHVAHIRPV